MVDIRESPSGPDKETGATTVESVFGRVGVVVAETGDYSTDLITNLSSVPGPTVTEALDALLSSDDIANVSTVNGTTLTDALDTLLAGLSGNTAQLRDTFQGGNANTISASTTNGAVGDLGWNFISFGAAATGSGLLKTPPTTNAVGEVLLGGPSTVGGGVTMYLGSPTAGLFDASDWDRVAYRCRQFNAVVGDDVAQFGVMNIPDQSAANATEAAVFVFAPSVSANFQTLTRHLGVSELKDTGIAANAAQREFTITRVNSALIDFRIDGVVVTSHTLQIPTGSLLPTKTVINGAAGTTSGFTTDTFTYLPL